MDFFTIYIVRVTVKEIPDLYSCTTLLVTQLIVTNNISRHSFFTDRKILLIGRPTYLHSQEHLTSLFSQNISTETTIYIKLHIRQAPYRNRL